MADVITPTAVSSLFSDLRAVRRKLKHSLLSSRSTGGSVQCKRDSRCSSVARSLFSQVLSLPWWFTPSFLTCLVSPPSFSHSSLSSATQSRPSSSSSLTYLPTTYTVFSHSVSHPLHPTHWQPSVTQDTTAIYPYQTISSCPCT